MPEKLLSSRCSTSKSVKRSSALKSPVIPLPSMANETRVDKEARDVGREPVNWLALMLRETRDDHFPIQLGKVPESWEPLASKKDILVRFCKLSGTDPTRAVSSRKARVLIEDRSPNSDGRLPSRLFPTVV